MLSKIRRSCNLVLLLEQNKKNAWRRMELLL